MADITTGSSGCPEPPALVSLQVREAAARRGAHCYTDQRGDVFTDFSSRERRSRVSPLVGVPARLRARHANQL